MACIFGITHYKVPLVLVKKVPFFCGSEEQQDVANSVYSTDRRRLLSLMEIEHCLLLMNGSLSELSKNTVKMVQY